MTAADLTERDGNRSLVSEKQNAFVEDDDSSSCALQNIRESIASLLSAMNAVVTEEDGSDVDSDSKSELDDTEELERALANYNVQDETLAERFYALKDMVSPTTRQTIAETWRNSTTWAKWGGKLAGNAVWVATTSALLVGLPLALAIENETMMVQQEKEMLAQQQGQQQMMGNPAGGTVQDGGLRPPGF